MHVLIGLDSGVGRHVYAVFLLPPYLRRLSCLLTMYAWTAVKKEINIVHPLKYTLNPEIVYPPIRYWYVFIHTWVMLLMSQYNHAQEHAYLLQMALGQGQPCVPLLSHGGMFE